jgi:hypothetical protein
MTMTDHEQRELRSYCSFLLREYGFHIPPTDPVIPALYIIHKETQLNDQNNRALAGLVKEAISKINPKVFNFNSPGEAWKFQVGIAFKWISGGLLVLILIAITVWYWSMKNNVDTAKTIIETSGNVSQLLKAVKRDKAGCFFIDFTAAKGDSTQHFAEFQKINTKTVRVYLGKDLKLR